MQSKERLLKASSPLCIHPQSYPLLTVLYYPTGENQVTVVIPEPSRLSRGAAKLLQVLLVKLLMLFLLLLQLLGC